ncbi:isoleucine--tRNA ligase [Candidatus Gromoviella agglomerans]|uniref:isoleucine--tRNA ligase n=1 Tax=Candidatus Gromoviella agglomerans TaxID=2806609 RepID=UPI001E38AC06|nr:isoleucine--tRNA ligase [Candidatus Gromoviella agglomerans]UFX98330.1 Isoleucine--tRNA ligase [Candidatus Gromoviella agglomerans]
MTVSSFQDYKDTLFLPETNFSMKANLSDAEPRILSFWKDIMLYDKLQNSGSKGKFILHSGPPFANGKPHLGHVLNFILKDVLCRNKAMRGYAVSFLWGWDCHGLPIEVKVEQEYKANKKDMNNVVEFRQSCRDFANYWLEVQKNDLLKIGLMTNSKEYYSTMDYKSEADILAVFFEFVKMGLVYRDSRPVMWSIAEKTAFAEAEIQYVDNHVSTACYVAFPLIGDINGFENISVLIWTTTTWTLPCNRAIAYGDDIVYSLVEFGSNESKKRFLIAKDLLSDFVSKLTISDECLNYQFVMKSINLLKNYIVLTEINGSYLSGRKCFHCLSAIPDYSFEVPLLSANYVESNVGTGFVHTAPSHGLDDYFLCKKNNIEAIDSVSIDGNFTDDIPSFVGRNIFDVIPDILHMIDQSENLFFVHKITHSYPYSWRSNTPLIFRMTPQWFIRIDESLKNKCLTALNQVEFIPNNSSNRISSMIKNRPDWCISRQRMWGIPLFIFVNKSTNLPLNDDAVMTKIIQHVAKNGADICFSDDVFAFINDKYDKSNYYVVRDVIDVWFESGATHNFVTKNMLNADRADIYVEGSDQHRGWFQSSLIESCVLQNCAPFKKILTHGFLMDKDGMKISKSKGNGVSIDELLKNNGADIMRLWALSSEVTGDIRISEEILNRVKDIYRKMRNVLRYLIGSIREFSVNEVIHYADMPDLEKYVCHEIFVLDEIIKKSFDECDFQKIVHYIHSFCSNISARYLDLRKDCLYCDSNLSLKRKSVRTIMVLLANTLIKWLSPILPFTSEDAWKYYKEAMCLFSVNSDGLFCDLFYELNVESVHLLSYFEFPKNWQNFDLYESFEDLFTLKDDVNQKIEVKRNEKLISGGLSCALKLHLHDKIGVLLEKVDVCDFFGVSTVEIESVGEFSEPQIEVCHASGNKCQRCWKYFNGINSICERCLNVLNI